MLKLNTPYKNFKAKAYISSLHLLLSLIIFALISLWLYKKAYPSFYFTLSGGLQGIWLMLFVDLILGPLLTFFVFNPSKSKREIISDLLIIACVQMTALGYGLHVMSQEKPQLVILYPNSTATIFTKREILADTKLNSTYKHAQLYLEQVPITLGLAHNGTILYSNPLKNREQLALLDKENRKFLKDSIGLKDLKTIEQSNGPVYILSIMGKYSGAYIIVDHNLKYLGKISEKPIN